MQKVLPPINPPWKIRDGIIILILINVFAYILRLYGQGVLIQLINILPGKNQNLNELLVSSFIQTALFLGFIAYFVLIRYRSSIKSLGLVKNRLAHWIKIGIINGITLFFIVMFIGVLINWLLPIEIQPQPIAKVIMSAQNKWEMLIPFIVASIFAPISEELYFRGFLYPALKRRIGVKWAILVTSVIFGSLHFDLVRMIPLAMGGIWLNLLYERSGSIYPSIVAHSVWNGIMTLLIFYVPQVA